MESTTIFKISKFQVLTHFDFKRRNIVLDVLKAESHHVHASFVCFLSPNHSRVSCAHLFRTTRS